jgi:hypothetical protein
MDNSKSLSNTILQSSEVSFPSLGTNLDSGSDSGSGFFDGLMNINGTTWIIIILILAFLGFNIFVYLAQGTQTVSDIFAPLVQKIFGTTFAVTGETVDVAAEGAKEVVGGTANVVNTGLTGVQNVTPNTASSSIKNQPVQNTVPQKNQLENDTLNKALNTSKQSQSQKQNDYEAQDASSSVHTADKPGWCYVGDDRGYRTCAEVGVNDQCMSGDIFPSQELCMNPNLRA